MKKITALILVLIFLLSLCACSDTDKPIKTESTGYVDKTVANTDKIIETTGTPVETTVNNDEYFIPQGPTDKGYWGPIITIKDNSKETEYKEISTITVYETELDTEIYDENLISVTAEKLSYDETQGPAITFNLCNLSEHNVTVESSLVIINGWVIPASFSVEVPTIEIIDYTLYLSESELKEYNISEICKIEVVLKVTDTDNGDFSGKSKTTRIYFNDKSNHRNLSHCEELFNQNDIILRLEETREKDTETHDYIARIFISNDSDKAASIEFTDINLEGVDTDIVCVFDAPANSSEYHELYFDKSTLKENDIENIKTIFMEINAYYTDTNEIFIDSGSTLYEIVQ